MSLTDQLAKVIKFNYYFLVYPLFRPAIRIYKRLLTGKLPFGAVILLTLLSILTIQYEDSRFVRQLFPGIAEEKTRKVNNKYETEEVLFEDGAICEAKDKAVPGGPIFTGLEPLPKLQRYVMTLNGVWALDPADSSKQRRIDPKAYKPDEMVQLCTTIEKGSATGVFAAWRRGPGRLLRQLFDMPVYSFPMRYLAPFIEVLFMELVFFTFFATVFMSFYVPLALVRLFMIMGRAYSPAETQKWTIAAETAWDPVLIQISDTHITNGGPPYEVTEDPQLWPRVPRLNTPERLARVFQELNRLGPKPPLVAVTGDLVDLGEEDEWNELEKRIKQFVTDTRALGGWLIRIMLIPGNHDISINKGKNPDHTSDHRSARIYRCSKFLSEVEREFEHNHVAPEWNEKFPCLIRTTISATEVNILALDSTRYISHWVLSNAVGRFGKRQLRKTQQLLATLSGPLIVLTHHHVSRPSHIRWSIADRLMSPLKIAIDGRRLLRILSSYAKQDGNTVLVLHGHQHQEFFEVYQPNQVGRVYVYGHPSSTMGIETDGVLDGILRCAVVGLAKSGSWQVQTHEFNS